MSEAVIELKHITKRFAKVLANDDVSLTIHKGEVVALLGENGAGKSTIMKILYGLYRATSGEILIDGQERKITSPKEAMNLGISMIQQHFSLVPAHTVTENIILGNCRGRIDMKAKEKEIEDLAKQYGFDVPAGEYIRNLTVGSQQKVEILKALYLNARVLIMDEPTAVLTPQEIDTVMEFVRNYVSKGNSVVFITHKMKEVMQVSDTIVVMRNGKVCGTVKREETDEKELAHMMIGHDLEDLQTPGGDFSEKKKRLVVENLTIQPKDQAALLDNVSFEIHEGEILGIAGVSENGQQELCEALYGAANITSGRILLDGKDITKSGVKERIEMGVGYTASDRYRYGMVAEMSLAENMLLKSSYLNRWSRHGIINWKKLRAYTDDQIKSYRIKAPDNSVTAGSLSGGNQQKLVVAREVDMGQKVIIFDQPTRGLDLGAINYVHKTILSERDKGKSVILVSTELSEIFALSDRIAVMYKGRIMGIYNNGELTTEKIGLLMAGYQPEEEATV
ncbi:MAG TPA: ABC transporter ATP-binding protein [Candidatus Blautia faecavium]|uniref:ABC transporter ATP-binding protein n=1 Tax=Candidatus Blautia faecavium TaxID=2838487 RepID=A0A9D2RXP7_9FIRM|nr:ABC transporter ATP-binding protein [Candidatus Blautia faecavium]